MNFPRSTWVKQLEVDIAVPANQLWDFFVSQMTYIVSGGALNSTHSPCLLYVQSGQLYDPQLVLEGND